MITDEQKRMVAYFWKEKGDVTRYVEWKEVEKNLKEEYPTLAFAFERYFIMEDIINSTLDDWMFL